MHPRFNIKTGRSRLPYPRAPPVPSPLYAIPGSVDSRTHRREEPGIRDRERRPLIANSRVVADLASGLVCFGSACPAALRAFRWTPVPSASRSRVSTSPLTGTSATVSTSAVHSGQTEELRSGERIIENIRAQQGWLTNSLTGAAHAEPPGGQFNPCPDLSGNVPHGYHSLE